MAERYITAVELEKRVGGPAALLLALPPASAIEASQRAGRAREVAEQQVTSALEARYGDQLPTTPAATGELLKALVADLALFVLLEQLPDGPDEAVKARHQIAVARLASLVSGELVLPKPPVSSSAAGSASVVEMDEGVLSPSNLAGWLQ